MTEKFVVYPAIFEAEKDPGYEGYFNVSFPDVPAADTYGIGLKEATHNAWESLGLNLYNAEKLPEASSLQEVQSQYSDAIVQYVLVDLEDYEKGVTKITPKVTKNTRIPKELANEAEELGINFSAVLTKALYKEVAELKQSKDQ